MDKQTQGSIKDRQTQEYENAIKAVCEVQGVYLPQSVVDDLACYVADTVADACQQTLEEEAYDYVMSNPPERGP